MPIEIRELVIKANVVQDGKSGVSDAASSGTNNNVSSNEELINTCVEKVLEIIKDKHGR